MRWAMAIKALVPSVEKLRFHSSGTEATLMAMRLSRAFTLKKKIVKLKNHFHGWHDYAMAEYAMESPGIPEATSNSVVTLPAGDLNAVENLLRNDRDIAGLILEPTGAHFGQLPLDAGFYLTGLRQVTKKYGTVLIFDEVVTGFRASPGGAQVRYSVDPDLTTMAKIVAGGLPGGAVGGRADIMGMMDNRDHPDWDNNYRVYHPGTFNANPISAIAGATCLELLADQPINRQADAMATRLKTGLNDIFSITGVAGHAHGIASMIHLVMAKCDCDREICSMPHQKIKENLASPAITSLKLSLQNCGIDIMAPSSFLVSAVHGENDIDRTLNAFQIALQATKTEGLL
jgi:glutamate-1-semialdehyde 2,1-aminomutase